MRVRSCLSGHSNVVVGKENYMAAAALEQDRRLLAGLDLFHRPTAIRTGWRFKHSLSKTCCRLPRSLHDNCSTVRNWDSVGEAALPTIKRAQLRLIWTLLEQID